MKNSLLLAAVMATGQLVLAQAKPAGKARTPVKKVAASVATMKNSVDSVSYSLGIMISQFYKQQGVSKVNTAMVSKAINDALKGGKPLLTEEQSNQCINNYITVMREDKASGNKKAGQDFLAANKTKPGIVTLPSGLQYQILKEGTGPKPAITDTVRCHYHGTLIDGTVFDSSVDRGQPAEFPVGAVIRGWVEALPMMPVGSKWKLFIPSDLGYGDSGAGAKIGPGSTLIFDVELLGIVGK
ncbi:MAG: FKBP-type peptidyl-prolyl cis-trans isomerase [Chitinophagaceae bacterium]